MIMNKYEMLFNQKISLKAIILSLLMSLIIGCQPATNSTSGTSTQGALRVLSQKSSSQASYCEYLISDSASYRGQNDVALYPLASLSKLFVTFWALDQLSAQFQFQTEWKIISTKRRSGEYDVFLKTNFDPLFTSEKIQKWIYLLRQQGVQSIRSIYLDDSSRIFSDVLNEVHNDQVSAPVSIDDSIIDLKKSIQGLIRFEQIRKVDQGFPQELALQRAASIPSENILSYLKYLNVTSNNYLADALFSYLGGARHFLQFQSEKLFLSSNQLVIKSGSGLPLQLSSGRFDNKASCHAVLTALYYFQVIAQNQNVSLGQLLLVPGRDQGTYESRLSFNSDVALKTGRLYDVPALNLAGYVATSQGLAAFVFLGHDFDNSEENKIKILRDSYLEDLKSYYRSVSFF